MKSSYYLKIHGDPLYLLNRDFAEVGERIKSFEIARFFNKELLPAAHCTVTVNFEGKCVGFFRLTLEAGRANALGTFVDKEHRRRGLATRMWRYAIKELGIKKIYVVATSVAGKGFLGSIADSELGDVFLDMKISGILDGESAFC